MFLVECKHYASNRPVGIEVIRNMYGVMGMNKRKPAGGIITAFELQRADSRVIDVLFDTFNETGE